jgi:hypothetical protein
MAEGKIEIKVGGVTFSGEGSETWLSSQLDKILKHLQDLVNVAPADPAAAANNGGTGTGAEGKKARGTLAVFLATKNAKANQTRKFLASAVWLHDGGGKKRLGTTDVVKALSDNNQGKLTNPSQCLTSNVTQGFCERDGRQFYVTDEGRTEIG